MNPVDIKHLLDAIKKANYKTRNKEGQFLESMENCVLFGRYATPAQAEWLQRIYRKSQGGGDHQNRGYV